MAIQIIHKTELGNTLEVAENKVEVKLDTTGNVQLTRTESGLKADVVFPTAFDPSSLNTKIQELEQAKAQAEAKAQELERKITALEGRDDIHLKGAVVEGTNLKLTTTDNVDITVDLATFLQVVPSAQDIYAQIKDTILADVKAGLRGEEVQDITGTSKGYLLAKD